MCPLLQLEVLFVRMMNPEILKAVYLSGVWPFGVLAIPFGFGLFEECLCSLCADVTAGSNLHSNFGSLS